MTAESLMRRTFELARLGLGHTFPNPLVGAVIVRDGRIIAEGYHHKYGQDHAELDAIKNCKEPLEGATLYVNLEPCCHTNKQTPPCAQRLVTEKFKKVVICNFDPNPLVNGEGVSLLRENGIEVEHGILSEEGELLNEAFFHAQKTKLPFIHLKLASTLDGKIAMPDGESQWITGPRAREHVHYLRSIHQGVIAGAHTVRSDNPKLNVRLPDFIGDQPPRIIFTQSGRLPIESQVLTDELKEKTLIYTFETLEFKFPAANVVKINTLREAMDDLYQRKLMNLMLEGGPTLATSFLREGFINRISLFLNPSFLGSGKNSILDLGISKLDERPQLKNVESTWLDGDLLVTGRLI